MGGRSPGVLCGYSIAVSAAVSAWCGEWGSEATVCAEDMAEVGDPAEAAWGLSQSRGS